MIKLTFFLLFNIVLKTLKCTHSLKKKKLKCTHALVKSPFFLFNLGIVELRVWENFYLFNLGYKLLIKPSNMWDYYMCVYEYV